MEISNSGRRRAARAAALLLLFAIGAPGGALAVPPQRSAPAALPPGVERVASVEGITECRLANGLRVLLFPDPSKPTITVNITYLVGSRNENYGETGMAHLLEHLAFKGTPRHPNIPQELSAHGAWPNGTTWYDRTNYFETFAATEENLKWALDLEADRMVNSFIAKKDLDTEMTVVRNEFERGENHPGRVLQERIVSTAFLWHNYGKSTIGARSDIENVNIERLQTFYRTYYQPDNAVLVVAGKFDETRALGFVNEYFGQIPRPARTIQMTYTADPTQDGERMVTLRRTGDTQALGAAYHVPAGSHPDFAAIDVLARVIGDNTTGRLKKALVDTKKAAWAYGFAMQLKEPGYLYFGAEVRQESSLEAARDAFVETIEGAATSPPTKDEVEKARIALMKGIDLTLNDTTAVALVLSEWIGMGDWRLLFLHRDRVRQVTPEEVQRVAALYLKPSNRTLGMFVPTPKPDRTGIPATPDVAALVKDYKGDEGRAMGEDFEATPENIEARVVRLEPRPGLRLALLPKKTRGGMVHAAMTLRFGDEKSLANRAMAARFAGAMLMRGTRKRTRQQLKEEFDRINAEAWVFGGADSATGSIATVRESLPAAMRLAAEALREPSFPADEFEQARQETLAAVEQGRSEPGTVASVAYAKHLSPYQKGDPRYVMSVDEEIEAIKSVTLDEAKRFYDEFYGASNAEIAVVGDFDPNEISALVAELLGDWKSPKPFSRLVGAFKDAAPMNQALETPDKANAHFSAGMNLAIRDDDPDYPALVLGNYILGGGFLNSRLSARIRQKEGISYGVGSHVLANALDRVGSFSVYAIYAPENLSRLEAAFREELERMLKDGFTAEEVAQAKSGYLQSRKVARAQDRSAASTLARYLFLKRTYAWEAEFERKIESLAPEQIHEAMRRHIDPSKLTVVKAGDFAGAASRK